MRLKQVRVDHFRNILDSGDVRIADDITCMVGKNEAGKTAFLQALYRLNPAVASPLDVHSHYPAWLEKRHRLQGKDPTAVAPIQAIFELTEAEQEALAEEFGRGSAGVAQFRAVRRYSGNLEFESSFDESIWVQQWLETNEADELFGEDLPGSAFELDEELGALNVAPAEGENDRRPLLAELRKRLKAEAGAELDVLGKVHEWLWSRAPRFLYFDNYSGLPGVLDIARIAGAKYEQLNAEEQTAKALLEVAYAETNVARSADYEKRKRELENTANALTQEVLDYWSQNTDIRVEIDFNQRTQNNNTVVHELHIRLYDNAHMLSLPFDERSSGFRWFFSFLCAFSRYRMSGEPVVILLDEPALGLHARAQRDFLRYVEEQLAPVCQVVYSTHSPFLVPPEHLDRIRLVEDQGSGKGSMVSDDVMSTDRDTLFPLQGALGYDLAQSMLVGPHNLIVEGTSDFTYLQLLSTHLGGLGRTQLDPRWTIVPVGGADQVATFAALLGRHVDATVLLDSHPKGNQRLENVVARGIFQQSRVIGVGEVLDRGEADIEDLFAPDEYLKLYNAAFKADLKLSQLKGKDPLVKRIARHLGVPRFDHGRPAEVLLRDHANLLAGLSDATRDRFEKLFERLNATLPSNR